MPCSTCKDVILLDPDDSGFEFTTTVTHVAGIDGRDYPIQSSLVPAPHQPRGGWKLEFTINGQATSVAGASAKAVVSQANQLFLLNEIPVSRLNLWFNANIQWLKRAVDKHQRVRLDHLLAVADTHALPDTGLHTRQRLEGWGEKGIEMLFLHLSQSDYNYLRFIIVCEEFRAWLEDPHLGSAAAYRAFSLALANLKSSPLYNQGLARTWLVDTRNHMAGVLGIPVSTMEEISVTYKWA